MELSFLHVSDVHFGVTDNDGEHERITKAIVTAVKNNSLSYDYILFTGDLAQKATATEFQQGLHWLEQLSEFAKKGIVLCPGHHDTNRTKVDSKCLRLAYGQAENFNLSKNTIENSHAHMEDFLNWCKDTHDERSFFLNTWNDNPFIDHVTHSTECGTVHFICLNSAVLSCDNEDHQKLCVDIKSLNEALNKTNTKEELVVVLSHHPSDWLVEWNKTKFNTLLGQETGPHIFCHGHVHEIDVISSSNSQGQSLFVSGAGAAYQGSKWPQFFTHLKVDFTANQTHPTVFKYSTESGQWLKNDEKSRPVMVQLPKIKATKQEDVDGINVTEANYSLLINQLIELYPNDLKDFFYKTSNKRRLPFYLSEFKPSFPFNVDHQQKCSSPDRGETSLAEQRRQEALAKKRVFYPGNIFRLVSINNEKTIIAPSRYDHILDDCDYLRENIFKGWGVCKDETAQKSFLKNAPIIQEWLEKIKNIKKGDFSIYEAGIAFTIPIISHENTGKLKLLRAKSSDAKSAGAKKFHCCPAGMLEFSSMDHFKEINFNNFKQYILKEVLEETQGHNELEKETRSLLALKRRIDQIVYNNSEQINPVEIIEKVVDLKQLDEVYFIVDAFRLRPEFIIPIDLMGGFDVNTNWEYQELEANPVIINSENDLDILANEFNFWAEPGIAAAYLSLAERLKPEGDAQHP